MSTKFKRVATQGVRKRDGISGALLDGGLVWVSVPHTLQAVWTAEHYVPKQGEGTGEEAVVQNDFPPLFLLWAEVAKIIT